MTPIRFLLTLLFFASALSASGTNVVSIIGEAFHLNGRPTYEGRAWQGHRLDGLLMNSRMVQGIYDDLNPITATNWAYPDTGQWDAERNTREFIEAMPEWRRHGLNSFTICLQGGSPQGYSQAQPWHNSAIKADGSLRHDYLARLKRILDRADELRMVVILGIFYFGQDQRLADEAAVVRAVDATVDWLFDGGWQHVVIEINNECNVRYDHAILQPDRVHELINRVKARTRDGRRFLVSTSYGGGTVPRTNVVQSADYLLLHGNGVSDPRRITEMVRQTRKVPGYTPKPVVFNEDDHFEFDKPMNNFVAAVSERAGWGYFDFRMKGEDFRHGFQSVPVDWSIHSPRKRGFFQLLGTMTDSLPRGATTGGGARWWKGNLHTHTLWSDGDDYPEMVAAWYKDQGYHFLALSDHNVTLDGTKWLTVGVSNRGSGAVFREYVERFGEDWVEQRTLNGVNQVRLKPLGEFRLLLEEASKFLLIPSEEVTTRHLTAQIHINVSNLRQPIQPAGGGSVVEVIQNNFDAVNDQRRDTGQPMVAHLNHPNFQWAITAEELMQVRGERFFEVYNGHPQVHNEGDALHASTERVWDIVLTWRLARLGLPPVFGLGVDDSHHYHIGGMTNSTPGRGWIQVRAPRLSPESIIAALEAGDFYASSGVTLKDIRRTEKRLEIDIAGETGVTYRTQFIGTRRGFDARHEPVLAKSGTPLRVTHRYSDEVGAVLAEVEGATAIYEMKGDELYVRAKIVSTKAKAVPTRTGETEAAWIQPVLP